MYYISYSIKRRQATASGQIFPERPPLPHKLEQAEGEEGEEVVGFVGIVVLPITFATSITIVNHHLKKDLRIFLMHIYERSLLFRFRKASGSGGRPNLKIILIIILFDLGVSA